MKKIAFLLSMIIFVCSLLMGQTNSQYKKYEQFQKQRERTIRYGQQFQENYRKYQLYSRKAHNRNNTASERAQYNKKAQTYYQRAVKQAQQYNTSLEKTYKYQRELMAPKTSKPPKYSEPKIPRINNPYQSPYPIVNIYDYPLQYYEVIEPKGGLAGYKSYYDY